MSRRMWILGLGAGLGLLLATGASCNSSPETSVAPCDGVFAGLCGSACSNDGQCPGGLYCSAGACTADCSPGGNECAPGVCDAHGRCVSGAGGGGGSIFGGGSGPGGSAGSGQGGGCPNVDVTFEQVTPTVVLLIDQSGSMTTAFNGQSRWNAVYHALMDPGGVVPALESTVRFGLVLYTYDTGPTCPALIELMPPVLNNNNAIDAVYAPAVPINNTPTGESISQILPEITAIADPGPKIIVLATDGDPDSCADPNSNGTQPPKDLSVAAVTSAFQQNIQTFVIAVGDEVSGQHQQDMANAGKGLVVPSPFPCDPVAQAATCAQTFNPATQADLVDAFNSIIFGQRSCTFTINGQVTPGEECQGVVKVNGQTVPCNQPNGWQLNSPTQIEFVGTACDTILNDPNVTVTASFPCDVIIPN